MTDTSEFEPEEWKDTRVTVVAGGLQQPIADLVERLAALQVKSLRDIVGESENGYCASVLMLSVLVFESLIARASHLRKMRTTMERSELSALKHLLVLDPAFPADLMKDLTEIYVLRDALAHAHLWFEEIELSERGSLDVTSRSLASGYGDPKHRAHVERSTGRTRRLNLGATPTSIGLLEAAVAMKALGEGIARLVHIDALESAASERRIKYQGQRVQFWGLAKELERMHLAKPERPAS